MPSAEKSKALKTPSREVKTLIDSVMLSVKLNSSILSCQVINGPICQNTLNCHVYGGAKITALNF